MGKTERGTELAGIIYKWVEPLEWLAGVGGALGIELDTTNRGRMVDSLLKLGRGRTREFDVEVAKVVYTSEIWATLWQE
jgi:hypothetical protein